MLVCNVLGSINSRQEPCVALSHIPKLDGAIVHWMVLFYVGCDPLSTTVMAFTAILLSSLLSKYLAVGKHNLQQLFRELQRGYLPFPGYCCSDPTEPVGDISENMEIKISCCRSHIVYKGHVSHVKAINPKKSVSFFQVEELYEY